MINYQLISKIRKLANSLEIGNWKLETGPFLILLLVVGTFLRLYNPQELFLYSHDHDLLGWIIRDIVEKGHLRLVGQETSVQGVFIGPLFYYLLIPFYKAFNMDPIGGVFYTLFLGVFSILSVYFVFVKIGGERLAKVATLVFSFSFYIVFTDREIVPTTLAMTWSVWYLYSVYLILRGNQKIGLFLSAVLLAITWNINLALLLLSPLSLLALFLSEKSLELRYVVLAAIGFVLISSPLLAFEARHNFSQIKAVYEAVTTSKTHIEGTGIGLSKMDRLFQLIYKNTTGLFFGPRHLLPNTLTFYLLAIVFFVLLLTKRLDWKLGVLLFFWQALYIAFFTANSLNLSEYYINGMNIVWIFLFALFVSTLFESKEAMKLAILIIFLFVVANLERFVNLAPNRIGYKEKRELISFVKKDAYQNSYPCISVSYITNPGYELGYRYLFFIEGMHVNRPDSQSPVYTIVFPHERVNRIDKSFGALGLVLPDYARYNEELVKESCSGLNSNITDPLFGYVE